MMIVQPGRFAGPACAIDPYAANRVFFLRGQGANGVKPATDETGKALTWSGAAQISTAASKWPAYGSSVSSPDYATDYLRTPNTVDFDFGSGDFTIRWLANLATATGTNLDFFKRDATGPTDFTLRVLLRSGNMSVFASSNGTSWNMLSDQLQVPVVTGAFCLYEVSRSGSNWYGLRDGALVATATAAGSIYPGAGSAQVMSCGNNAYFNDFQVYKGVCLHTSAYAPATLPPC